MPPESPVPGWSTGEVCTLITARRGAPLAIPVPAATSRWYAVGTEYRRRLEARLRRPQVHLGDDLPHGPSAAHDRRTGEGAKLPEGVGGERIQLLEDADEHRPAGPGAAVGHLQR